MPLNGRRLQNKASKYGSRLYTNGSGGTAKLRKNWISSLKIRQA